MSYNHIADAASDSDLRRRVAACFAQQTTGTEQPEALASVHMWRIAADNDIAAAYAYGVDTNVPNPGPGRGGGDRRGDPRCGRRHRQPGVA